MTNEVDKCVYSKFDDNVGVIICFYVDDMIIMGTCLDVVIETKKFLSSSFDIKDMGGEVDFLLGIKIRKSIRGIMHSQEHHVEKILKKFDHFDCKFVSTPYDANSRLKKNKETSVSQNEYAQLIGSLIYLMNCTYPNIAYAISRLSHYTQSPNREHWTALNKILKYLKGTINYRLMYFGLPAVLEGYRNGNCI